MRIFALLGFATAASFVVQAASAQDIPTTFRGFYVEGNLGGDRFNSEGTHNNKFGYGATAGFDGTIAERFVVGFEGSYWHANKWTENCTGGVNGGSVCRKSFQEYGAAVRAGYLVTPKLLVFGKGGFVSNEQRKRFDSPGTLLYISGQIVGPEQSYYNHASSDGYQLGGGVEYSLTDRFFTNVQYVYSNYEHRSIRQRAMAGVGVRF